MNDNLYESLRNICEKRKSIRNFKEDKIPKEDIEKIIHIASLSPYAGGRKKSWDIMVVDKVNKIQKIADIVETKSKKSINNIKPIFRNNFLHYSKSFYSFRTAPVILIPIFKLNKGIKHIFEKPNDKLIELERDGVIKSIACVCMLILLAAESLGYGACFVHGACIANSEIIKLLGTKKNIAAIIPIGYEKKKESNNGAGK